MNVSSMTYNGQQIDPEGFLSGRKYETIQFLLSKVERLISFPTTEPDIVEFQSNLSRSLFLFDEDLSMSGYITCDYDHRLDKVTIPIKDSVTNDSYTVIFKWKNLIDPLKVQILDY